MKQSQKRKRQNTKRKKTQKKPSIAPSLHLMNNPFASLSDDERKKVIEEVCKNSERLYIESINRIKGTFTEYDPITLLSVLASYGLTVPIGKKGLTKKDSDFDIKQSHIELCQAFALQINPNDLRRMPFGPDIVQELWEALPTLLEAHNFRKLSEQVDDTSGDKKAVSLVQQFVRGNTQLVRNWGYFSQVTQISKELYEAFDKVLQEEYGFTANDILKTFRFLIDRIEERNTERYQKLSKLKQLKGKKELIYKYHELIDQKEEHAKKFISGINIDSLNREQIFYMLLSHYDLRLPEIYTFSTEEISNSLAINESAIESMFGEFSYSFGDLQNYDTEYLYLSNPVWLRPVIRIEQGRYFCAIPQLFYSFVIPSIEKLIEANNRDQLSERRANYLERKVTEIIHRRFPESNTISGIKWKLDNIEYETDLITFIDSHALIVEAKSGKISEPALRGAPDRLKKHINEILVEPNLQSNRLKDRLLELVANPDIDDDLREKLPVDLNTISKVIRVSLTLEDFAMLQANISRLKDTGWLPNDYAPCPTMNLADFETLFDFLEHPVQIIHYLERREELEDTIVIIGDELDLMGLYIDTLFNIGAIKPDVEMFITEMSAPLDAYYNSRDAGIVIEKPKPKISPLFADIFDQLEDRMAQRWTEIGVILNRFSPDDQIKLMTIVKTLKNNVRKNWRVEGHRNIAIYTPPKASEYALCYVVYNHNNAHRRNDFIDEAAKYGLAPKHVTKCVVIAKNMDDNDLAYHFIGVYQ